jgi:hypothetical protein
MHLKWIHIHLYRLRPKTTAKFNVLTYSGAKNQPQCSIRIALAPPSVTSSSSAVIIHKRESLLTQPIAPFCTLCLRSFIVHVLV